MHGALFVKVALCHHNHYIIKKFLKGTLPQSLTCLDSKFDYFQVLSMVQSFFNELFCNVWGEG